MEGLAAALLMFFPCLPVNAQVPTWRQDPANGIVPRNTKFEASFELGCDFADPYDPDAVEVNALITRPDGSTLAVPCFWYEGFRRALVNGREELTPTGERTWKLRYTPRTLGDHQARIEARDKRAGAVLRFPANGGAITFTAVESAVPGFLRVSGRDAAHLEFEDGRPFLGIGHNLCGWEWPGAKVPNADNRRGTFDYDDWLAGLASNGANLTQFDFCEGDQIEWTFHPAELPYSRDWGGLGKCNQQTAWKMDYRFAKAEELGVFFRVSLFHWEDFDNETGNFPDWGWTRNPYNARNGGPASNAPEFFTNAGSLARQRKLLRYLVARYGYSPNLLAWELWNEVDKVSFAPSNYAAMKAALTTWHQDTARCLRQIDVNQHLATTSFDRSDREFSVWRLPEIDFTTIHRYTLYNAEKYPQEGFRQFQTEEVIDRLVSQRRLAVAKPVLLGEFALSPGGRVQRDEDPAGIAFHNQLWASVMAKSLGTAMHWTWGSYLHTRGLYTHYRPLADFFPGTDLRGTTPFNNYNAAPGDAPPLRYAGLKDRCHAWVWVQDRRHTFADRQSYSPSVLHAQQVTLTGLDDGLYLATVHDTYQVRELSRRRVTVSGGTIILDLPDFTRDVAVKLAMERPTDVSAP